MIKNHDIYHPLYTDRDHFIILVTGGRGCERPNTEVMMADLSVKQIKDIEVGDYVMGDDFQPRLVLNTCRGYSEMFRVHQTSADDYFVNDAHILTVKKSEAAKNDKGNLTKAGTYRRPNGRYPAWGDISDMSIKEFSSHGQRFQSHFRGFKIGSIPFKEQNVNIEPYLLGLWLGDGTSIFPRITNPEPEVVGWLEDYCVRHNQTLAKQFKQGAWHMGIVGSGRKGGNSFLTALKSYNLIGNKHIPQEYISNSENIRLELLAGLLDTDGFMSRNGYEITQKNFTLAKKIKYVADTLGFRTSINEKHARCNGKDCGVVYRIHINGDVWRIPCKVKRKKVRQEDCHKNKDWRLSQLSVESVGLGDWCGIMIDGNHRYLHSDGTVTHNSGKSFGVATFIERLTFELKKRGMGAEAEKIVHNILYSRYTMVSAAMSVIPEFMEKVEADGTQKYFHATRTDVVNRMTGSKIMFRGLRTSSGNQTARLKSIHGITTFVCDEAEEWTSEKEFETIAFSIRQPGIQNRIIVMMNPTDSNHFIYQKYIKDTHETREYDGVPVQISTHPQVLHIHTTYLDNIEHLSDEFVASAKEMKERDPEKYAHIFMGQWSDVAEGAVFKKWGVVNEFPAHAKKVALGADFGYTNDPTAMVRCGIVGNDLYLDEVCYQQGMGITELAGTMRREGLFVYAESADPRLIDEIANRGVIIYPVAKPAGSVVAGIERMKDFDNIFVTARSYNLQQELRNYVWAKDKDGNYINVPEDANNHCFAGDTMISTINGPVPMSEIMAGDIVATSSGYRMVKKKYNNGVKPVLKVRLVFDGIEITLKGTADHKIKTTQGWKNLDKLKAGDKLFLFNTSMGRSTHCMKVKNISQGEIEGFIGTYGNITMGKFPPDTMSTIGTTTPTITKSVTWNLKNPLRTFPTIRRKICRILNTCSHCVTEWIMQEVMQLNGTGPKWVENGTGNMVLKLQQILKRGTMYAFSAGKRSEKSHSGKSNSAPMPVKQGIGINPASTMRLGFAKPAAMSLSPINTAGKDFAPENAVEYSVLSATLKDIEMTRVDSSPVFDLEVEGQHEYFANGILVHNCMDAVRYYIGGHILGQIVKPRKINTDSLHIF